MADVSSVNGLLNEDQSRIPCCFVMLLLVDLPLVVGHHHPDGCIRGGRPNLHSFVSPMAPDKALIQGALVIYILGSSCELHPDMCR